MKKNELIKKLLKIDGDPEIVIYNGATDYCHSLDAKIEIDLFVKRSFEHFVSKLQFEEMKKRSSFDPLPEDVMKAINKKAKQKVKDEIWELPNPNYDEEEFKKTYGENQRKVIVLNMKKKGVCIFDRFGTYEC